jgi:iron(III) transport system ATP-binding protein
VALARALAPAPDVVLLDEPFAALDTSLRETTRDDVARLLRRRSATVVMVTHDPVEAVTVGDRVAVMQCGKIVQVGRPRDVYHRPVDARVARALGPVTVLPGTLCETTVIEAGERRSAVTVDCALGRLPVAWPVGRTATGPVDVLVRPEQIVPVAANTADATTGQVLDVRFEGAGASVTLGLVDGSELVAWWPSTIQAVPGEQVALAVSGPVSTSQGVPSQNI